jgi:hypothetical protein
MARYLICTRHPSQNFAAFAQKRGTAKEILDDIHLRIKFVADYAEVHGIEDVTLSVTFGAGKSRRHYHAHGGLADLKATVATIRAKES